MVTPNASEYDTPPRRRVERSCGCFTWTTAFNAAPLARTQCPACRKARPVPADGERQAVGSPFCPDFERGEVAGL